MDSSEIAWLSEMGQENSIFMGDDRCDFMDNFGDEMAALLGPDNFDTCFSPANQYSLSSSSTLINISSTNSVASLCTDQPPAKLHKPNNYSDFSTRPVPDRPSSGPIILSFGNDAEIPQQGNKPWSLSPEEEVAVSEVLRSTEGSFLEEQINTKRGTAQTTKKASRVRPPSQTYDHIVAERKRREQLSQRFVALSTIVPGLKKMDKTSVLGDAIKYLKHLQERVKTLEEQAKKQTMESVVLVKRSQIMVEDEGSSDDISGGCSHEQPLLPEIEARVCNSHILIKVQCEKQKGVLVNLLSEVEKLNLAVVNTNATHFGNMSFDITITAEMDKEFKWTAREVVKRLRAAL